MKAVIILVLIFSVPVFAFQDRNTASPTTSDSEKTGQKVDSLSDLGYSLWIRNPEQSVAYGDQAYKIAEEIGYDLGSAYAKRISGVAHWALGEPRLALEDLYKALQLYSKIKNTEGIANTKLNVGMVYADIDEDATAEKFYKEAINEFTALELDGRVATAFTKIGTLYLENKKYADALVNLTNALNIHTKNDFDYGMAEAHNRLGTLYLDQEDLEQADYHLRQSLVLSKKIDDKDGKISSMLQYGRLQRKKQDYQTAAIHFKWGLREASEHKLNKYKLLALKNIVDLKKELNQPDSALFYYDWYIELKDSVFNSNKSKQIAALEYQSDLDAKEKELLLAAEKDKNNTTIQWILFVGIWVLLLLSIFLIKSLRQRNSNQKKVLEQERIIAAKELESQKSENVELEQELELKNKELTSYALNFVQKNEFLAEMKLKIQELKPGSGPLQSKKISEMERLLKLQQSKDKDWEDFRHHFEQVHSGFFTHLKTQFPTLSANDLKVAALTRLNLSIKETSNILGISPESTKTARYRLRKKLNLKPEYDLFDFLLQYNNNL
ncbi:MAG: tetratricopeptide repeat protein [Leeuwenhoekiella sp.]